MYIGMYKNKLLEGGDQMEITDVKIRKVNSGNRMKAIASITIDGGFVVHEIKVIEGKDGLFMAMPRREKNGKFIDIAHPINQDVRNMIQEAILEAYDKAEDPMPIAESENQDVE